MTSNLSPTAKFFTSLRYPLQFVALHPSTGRVRCFAIPSTKELPPVLRKAGKLNEQGWNLYYEVNIGQTTGKRSKAADITHLRAVVGDVDNSPDRTIDDCRELVARLPISPSFTVFTGGGLQVVYLLAEFQHASETTLALYTKAGRSLRDAIKGDAVFDAPRIMRLPGFINHPCAKKAALGRTPTRASVEHCSDRTFVLEDLVAALGRHHEPQAQQSPLAVSIESGLSTESWFDRLSPDDQNACLKSLLSTPGIIALADTPDGAPYPNWRTVLAACARSGAPAAEDLAREWAATSTRFSPRDFAARWRSYARS